MKKRKKILWIFLLSALCCLSACQSRKAERGGEPFATEEETGGKGKRIVGDKDADTILRWAVWDAQTTNYWKAIATAYVEKHPDVRIELCDLGSGDYSSTLAMQMSVKGSEFDIVTIKDMPGYETLVAKDALEPLNFRVSRDEVMISQYKGITEQLKADGELYQFPFRSDFWLLFYNKDLFDEAGVEYPDNDMTMEEYDRLARQVAGRREDGRVIYGTHYHTWRSTVQLFGILDGKHSILDGEYDFTKPYYEMVKAQEKDGVCRSYIDTNVAQLHYSAAFAAGNTAMMNMGSWFINTLLAGLESGEYERELCGNWGIVSYPHPEGVEAGTTLGTITGLAISKESRKKEEAWEFIKFAISEESAEVIARTGTIPAVMSEKVIQILTQLDGFPKDETSMEALQTGHIYLEAPYDNRISEINTILDEYHKDIMDESITLEAGIQKMNQKISGGKEEGM